MPHTWQDEVDHMRSELARSHASLRLEEHRNRALPPLPLPSTSEEYDTSHNEAVSRFMTFLDEQEIIRVKQYMDPALRARIGSFSSSGRPEHFFAEVDYRDPLTMRAHGYHWIELAHMREAPHPNPIRCGALLYNIFQYRSEGLATGMEEFAMRASRGLAGLNVHANLHDVPTAADLAVEGVPRGWFRKRGPLVLGEQDLYLSQPGYGSTYLMGKLQLAELMKDRSIQLGEEFSIRTFFEQFNASGIIPISLIRWEMTGRDDEIRELLPD